MGQRRSLFWSILDFKTVEILADNGARSGASPRTPWIFWHYSGVQWAVDDHALHSDCTVIAWSNAASSVGTHLVRDNRVDGALMACTVSV